MYGWLCVEYTYHRGCRRLACSASGQTEQLTRIPFQCCCPSLVGCNSVNSVWLIAAWSGGIFKSLGNLSLACDYGLPNRSLHVCVCVYSMLRRPATYMYVVHRISLAPAIHATSVCACVQCVRMYVCTLNSSRPAASATAVYITSHACMFVLRIRLHVRCCKQQLHTNYSFWGVQP